MYNLNQDEFSKLLSQHQSYVNSLGETGTKVQINKFNLSKLKIKNTTLTDSFITESIFYDNQFENVEIFDANLCGCEFNNVVFFNSNFVKTDLSYSIFKNCKFINTKLIRCETDQTIFEYTQFMSCVLEDIFSYSSLKNILFCDMDLKHLEFYNVIIDNIKFKNIEEFDVNKAVISLNTGNFKNENIIKGENAVEYFQKSCVYDQIG